MEHTSTLCDFTGRSDSSTIIGGRTAYDNLLLLLSQQRATNNWIPKVSPPELAP